jgi:hypothetical protein
MKKATVGAVAGGDFDATSLPPQPLWEWFRQAETWLPLAQVGATNPRRVVAIARRLGLTPHWVGLRRAYTWGELELVIAELRRQQEVEP